MLIVNVHTIIDPLMHDQKFRLFWYFRIYKESSCIMFNHLGDTKGYEYETVGIPWLEKKVEFCRDHLKLQAKLAPGLSEYRAYIAGEYQRHILQG